MSSTDRIEKKVVIAAPQSRVWRAIADAKEFGAWFGFELEGPFAPGQTVRGRFDESKLDKPMIMAAQERAGVKPVDVRMPPDSVFCTVERIEPERYFSFRWHPFGIDVTADLANEPTTLVELALEKSGDGTLLTIVESGFDRIPEERRARAFRMNQGGWAAQAENIRKYVESR